MSIAAVKHHANQLFDPHSTPTIYFGPAAVPSAILPLIISVAFVCYKVSTFQTRRNREIEIAQLPPVPDRDDLLWPDIRHPDALRIYLARANFAFHGVITNGAIMHLGASFLETKTLACAEVIALLLYAEFVKPEVRKSSLAAAAGWVLSTYLDSLPDLAAVGVVVLAAPIAWQIDGFSGEVEYQQSSSGLLLMLIAANKVFFQDQIAVQEWTRRDHAAAWKYLATFHFVNGLMMYVFNRNRDTRLSSRLWNLQETLAGLKRFVLTASRLAGMLVAFAGPFAGGVVSTAYLASCLPWSGLMFGKCASSPSLSSLSITAGLYVYTAIWLIVDSTRRHRRPRFHDRTPTTVFWKQLKISVDVIGWACLFLSSLFVVLGMLIQ